MNVTRIRLFDHRDGGDEIVPRSRSTRRNWVVAGVTAGVFALCGCAPTTGTEPAPTFDAGPTPAPAPAHWAYDGEDGPDHWAELSTDYETCEAGTEQSPIDLSHKSTTLSDALELDYGTVTEHVTDTGHTFQLNADADTGLSYQGTDYSLVQMHFHDPSEHTIDGVAAPVEFHFLNTDDTGKLLVISVLAREGAHNPHYEAFIDATTSKASEGVSGEVDLAAMLPESLQHFAYSGSLTTPPCTEGVQWIVMNTPVELDSEQIAELQGAYAHNNRPVQPVGDRIVGYADSENE
jgi:carbonic anhydrase